MLAHTNIPFKGHGEMRESRKLRSKPLFYYFSLGTPDTVPLTKGISTSCVHGTYEVTDFKL